MISVLYSLGHSTGVFFGTRTCVLVPHEDLSSCSTKRHVFLLYKNQRWSGFLPTNVLHSDSILAPLQAHLALAHPANVGRVFSRPTFCILIPSCPRCRPTLPWLTLPTLVGFYTDQRWLHFDPIWVLLQADLALARPANVGRIFPRPTFFILVPSWSRCRPT